MTWNLNPGWFNYVYADPELGCGQQDALLDTNMSRPDIYSRFFITGKEISAFLVDGKLQWSDIPSLSSPSFRGCVVGHDSAADSVQSNHRGTVLPVLDRCGMSLVLDQVSSARACQ